MSEKIRIDAPPVAIPEDAADAVFRALTEAAAASENEAHRARFGSLRTKVADGTPLDIIAWSDAIVALRFAEERAPDIATSKATKALIARLEALTPWPIEVEAD